MLVMASGGIGLGEKRIHVASYVDIPFVSLFLFCSSLFSLTSLLFFPHVISD